jgi:hypothetical protein
MKVTKLDWRGVGQFVAVLVNITTIITTTMKKVAVGIEILDWLTGAGKMEFVAMLEKLGESYKKSAPQSLPVMAKSGEPYVIHYAKVNLAVQPKLPFVGAIVESNVPGGTEAVVELKSNDHLYLNGKKIILHLEAGQRSDSMHGHTLREALTGKSVLNAALLDFLTENQHFIPHHWKVDENGNTRCTFFWGTIYVAGGGLYVRYLYWDGGGWRWRYNRLNGGWSSLDPAAVSAS